MFEYQTAHLQLVGSQCVTSGEILMGLGLQLKGIAKWYLSDNLCFIDMMPHSLYLCDLPYSTEMKIVFWERLDSRFFFLPKEILQFFDYGKDCG